VSALKLIHLWCESPEQSYSGQRPLAILPKKQAQSCNGRVTYLLLTSNIRGLFIGVSTTIYSRSEAGQIQVQLEALLEETVAYRSFFLRADLDRLV